MKSIKNTLHILGVFISLASGCILFAPDGGGWGRGRQEGAGKEGWQRREGREGRGEGREGGWRGRGEGRGEGREGRGHGRHGGYRRSRQFQEHGRQFKWKQGPPPEKMDEFVKNLTPEQRAALTSAVLAHKASGEEQVEGQPPKIEVQAKKETIPIGPLAPAVKGPKKQSAESMFMGGIAKQSTKEQKNWRRNRKFKQSRKFIWGQCIGGVCQIRKRQTSATQPAKAQSLPQQTGKQEWHRHRFKGRRGQMYHWRKH